jgi:hypothetical protein
VSDLDLHSDSQIEIERVRERVRERVIENGW